eukprot:tig00000403_g304.t1
MRGPAASLAVVLLVAAVTAVTAAPRAKLLVVDAGSSGSRISGFEYDADELRLDPTKIFARPLAPGVTSAKVRPGLSSLEPEQVAPYLADLLSRASGFVPEAEAEATPLFLYATAGLRMLEDARARRLLEAARAFLSNRSACPYAFRRRQAQVISGPHEGVFGWLALNHLLGTVGEDGAGRTAAALDMGGGSLQITYEPVEPPIANEFPLRLGETLYPLYSHSYLQFGRDAAENRYREAVAREAQQRGLAAADDPCQWAALEATVPLGPGSSVRLRGTGNAALCAADIRRLIIGGEGACAAPPCGMNGEHAPALPPEIPIYAWATFSNIGRPLGCLNETSPACFYAKAAALALLPAPEASARLQAAGCPPEFVPGLLFSALFCHEAIVSGLRVPASRALFVVDRVAGVELGWAFGAAMFEARHAPPPLPPAPDPRPARANSCGAQANSIVGPRRPAVLVVAGRERTEVVPVLYVRGRFGSVEPLGTFPAGPSALEAPAPRYSSTSPSAAPPPLSASPLPPRASPASASAYGCAPPLRFGPPRAALLTRRQASSALRGALAERGEGGRLRLLARAAVKGLAGASAPAASARSPSSASSPAPPKAPALPPRPPPPPPSERKGRDAAAMAWLHANWLLGALYDAEDGARHAAVADLRPASLRVAALPGESPAAHAFPLVANGTVFDLYALSYHSLGLDAARARYGQRLAGAPGNATAEAACSPSGRPDLERCRADLRSSLLALDAFCAAPPCAMFGSFQPRWDAGQRLYAVGLFAEVAQAAGCAGESTPSCLLRRAGALLSLGGSALAASAGPYGDAFSTVYVYEVLTSGLRVNPDTPVIFASSVEGREVSWFLGGFAYFAQMFEEAEPSALQSLAAPAAPAPSLPPAPPAAVQRSAAIATPAYPPSGSREAPLWAFLLCGALLLLLVGTIATACLVRRPHRPDALSSAAGAPASWGLPGGPGRAPPPPPPGRFLPAGYMYSQRLPMPPPGPARPLAF